MLGFKCFIFGVFFWLSFGSLQDFNGRTVTDNNSEITSSTNTIIYNSLIVDGYLETNPVNWSFNGFKIPKFYSNSKLKQPIAETYNYKLSYIEIGDNIPLNLTSWRLIFPFHSFT